MTSLQKKVIVVPFRTSRLGFSVLRTSMRNDTIFYENKFGTQSIFSGLGAHTCELSVTFFLKPFCTMTRSSMF